MRVEDDRGRLVRATVATVAGRTCVFCGGFELTREHAWPAWLSGVVPEAAEVHSHLAESTEYDPRPWDAPALEAHVRRVCASCNSGWMSRLETAAKPVITSMVLGRRRNLHRDGQGLVALWAVKTAMMLALASGSGSGIPSEHYEWVYVNGTVPPQAFVSVASYGGTRWTGFHRHHVYDYEVVGASVAGYASTFSVKHLVLQVWAAAAPPEHLRIERHGAFRDTVKQISPFVAAHCCPLATDSATAGYRP